MTKSTYGTYKLATEWQTIALFGSRKEAISALKNKIYVIADSEAELKLKIEKADKEIERIKKENTCECGTSLIGHFHTKKWYVDTLKINPERLNIVPTEVENPHYKNSAPMKLYKLCQVKNGLDEHPEFTIKPRTEKQQAASKKNGKVMIIKNKINMIKEGAVPNSLKNEQNHFEWHQCYGKHRHDMTKWGQEIDEKVQEYGSKSLYILEQKIKQIKGKKQT